MPTENDPVETPDTSARAQAPTADGNDKPPQQAKKAVAVAVQGAVICGMVSAAIGAVRSAD